MIEDIAPVLFVMDMTMMQRIREERDSTGQAIASRLGVTWPPEKRTRRLGRPTADALWCDALQN